MRAPCNRDVFRLLNCSIVGVGCQLSAATDTGHCCTAVSVFFVCEHVSTGMLCHWCHLSLLPLILLAIMLLITRRHCSSLCHLVQPAVSVSAFSLISQSLKQAMHQLAWCVQWCPYCLVVSSWRCHRACQCFLSLSAPSLSPSWPPEWCSICNSWSCSLFVCCRLDKQWRGKDRWWWQLCLLQPIVIVVLSLSPLIFQHSPSLLAHALCRTRELARTQSAVT